MKRSAVALLAIIYFAISSGVVVNIHYCMGKMSTVKLQAMAPSRCGCGKKMESKKGCCKTELKVVKIEDAQKATYADLAVKAPATPFISEISLLETPFYNAREIIVPKGHSPPITHGQETYLRNCVFRI